MISSSEVFQTLDSHSHILDRSPSEIQKIFFTEGSLGQFQFGQFECGQMKLPLNIDKPYLDEQVEFEGSAPKLLESIVHVKLAYLCLKILPVLSE